MILVPVLGTGFAGQLIKVVFQSIRKRRWRLGLLGDFEAFPSLHPLLGGCLVYQVAEETGWESVLTALAMAFTGVVIYDASGVKRAAGNQARLLKQLGPRQALDYSINEWLGQSPFRTWLTVFSGMLLGVIVERAWVALISLSW